MQKYFAELVGTFVLVFAGIGSAVLAGDKIGWVGIAFAFGLALLVMVYTIGPVSGCHINPAVTLGLLISRKISAMDAVIYAVVQVVGGILAAGMVLLIAREAPGGYNPAVAGLAANGYGDHSPGHYSLLAGLISEVILTALLVFTVLSVTDVHAPVGFAGIAIGLVLVLMHFVGIPITNASFNPARSIGPALFVGGWALQQLRLFIVAPLIGGALAAGVYAALRVAVPQNPTAEAEQALASEQVERLS
jgi:aquaporin Z